MPGQGPRKKLREAARLLARGDFSTTPEQTHEDQAAEDAEWNASLQIFGLVEEADSDVDDDTPSQPPAAAEPQVFYLWPENLPAWRLWRSVQTQWRFNMQGPTGLDYAGVLVRMGRVGPRRQARLLDDIQIMEEEVLREAARQREARRLADELARQRL